MFDIRILSPYNEGRTSQSKKLQDQNSVRKLSELDIDGVAHEAEGVEMEKPVEKHQGEVLKKKRTKGLRHILHRIDELVQVSMKVVSLSIINNSLLILFCSCTWFCWRKCLLLIRGLQNTFGKCSIVGTDAVEGKFLVGQKEMETKGRQHKNSNYTGG